MDAGETRKRQADDEDQEVPPTSVKRVRTFKTCEWITEKQIFRTWQDAKDGDSRLLWVHGPPGSGKSFLSKFVAERLAEVQDQPPVASYLCEEASSAPSIVQSILAQLASNPRTPASEQNSLSKAVETLSARTESSPASPEAAWDILSSALNEISAWTLVIDGVDELKPPLLNGQDFNIALRLRQLASDKEGITKLYLSSRVVPSIHSVFKDINTITLTQSKLENDLRAFATDIVSSYSNLVPYRDELVETLVTRADGIFTWIEFAVQSLALETTEAGIKERLRTLPLALSDLYTSLFDEQSRNLSWGHRQIRDSILRWISNAVRPLNISELANALSVSTNAFSRDFESKALTVSGHLVKIENDQLHPVHQSLLDFLRAPNEAHPDLAALQGKRAHTQIAVDCLRYLSHPAFEAMSQQSTFDLAFRRDYPLLEYSVLYWVHHVSQADHTTSELQTLILQFLAGPLAFFWMDTLLQAFLSRSVLTIPPRPKNTARLVYLFSLKSHLLRFFHDKASKEELDRLWATTISSAYEKALSDVKANLGMDHPDVIQRTLDLGEVYGWLPGQRSRSETLFAEAYETAQRVGLSASTAPTSVALGNAVIQAQADSLKRGGKYDEARSVLEELVERVPTQPSSPDRDNELMFALDSLGWVCMRLGSLDDAANYLFQALELSIKLHGSTSPLTLRSRITLAEVLVKLGRLDESTDLCQQLIDQLDSQQKHGTPMPVDSISHLNILAGVYMAQGKYDEAIQTFSAVVDHRRTGFGEDAPMTLWATMQLGLAMEKSNSGTKDVAALFADLIPRQEKVLGAQHPDVDTSRKALGRVQGVTG